MGGGRKGRRPRHLRREAKYKGVPSFKTALRRGANWLDRLSPKKQVLCGAAAVCVFLVIVLIAMGPPIERHSGEGPAKSPPPPQQQMGAGEGSVAPTYGHVPRQPPPLRRNA